MSPMYEYIKAAYDDGDYTKGMVWDLVGVGAITPGEYKLITGDVYDPNDPPLIK